METADATTDATTTSHAARSVSVEPCILVNDSVQQATRIRDREDLYVSVVIDKRGTCNQLAENRTLTRAAVSDNNGSPLVKDLFHASGTDKTRVQQFISFRFFGTELEVGKPKPWSEESRGQNDVSDSAMEKRHRPR